MKLTNLLAMAAAGGLLPAPLTEAIPGAVSPDGLSVDHSMDPMKVDTSAMFLPGPGQKAAAAPADWKPGFGAQLEQFLFNNGSWSDAGRELTALHDSDEASKADLARLGKVAASLPPDQAAALLHDPKTWASNMNANYAPRAVGGGERVSAFGRDLGTAPKVGMNDGGVGYVQDDRDTVATGRVPVPMTQAQVAKAADDARNTAIKESLAPAQIGHLNAMGSSALMNARRLQAQAKSGGGGGGAKSGGSSFGRSINVGGMNYTVRTR